MQRELYPPLFKAMVLITLLWVMYVLNIFLETDLRQFGVRPREWEGLIGILMYPLLHGNLEHLAANSAPAFVLGYLIFLTYKPISIGVLGWSWVMTGVWLWVGARSGTNHIGFSGIIYAMGAFIFFSGLIRKYYRMVALSMLVVFLYGYMVWGVLPLIPGQSWEGHLFGVISGIVLAIYYRQEGPQRPKYSWEIEPEEEDSSSAEPAHPSVDTTNPTGSASQA